MIIFKNKLVNYCFLFALVAFAIYTRYWGLMLKPIHFDESINGWFLDQISKTGYFKYDPSNYHGPLFFYIEYAFQKFFSVSLWSLRFVTTTFSFLLVVLFAFQKDRKANVLAFLLAVSTSSIFYGRSGIHESLFVFLSLVGWWILIENDKENFGLGVSCLILATAVKETWVLQAFAAIFAFLFSGLWKNLLVNFRNALQTSQTSKNLMWILAGLMMWIICFSAGFRHPKGLFDFFVAFMPWAKTGVQGSGHDKVWSYWLELIFKNDLIVFLSMIWTAQIFFLRKMVSQKTIWMAIFAWVHFVMYSVIPYKTPWCVISIAWPFLWLASDLLTQEISGSKSKNSRARFVYQSRAWWFFLVAAIVPASKIYDATLREPIDLKNPYVYVNGTESMRQFHLALQESNLIHDKDQIAQISLNEYWPYPWILREWHLNLNKIKERFDASASIYACELSDRDFVEANLVGKFYRMQFATRQDTLDSIVYVKENIAKPFLRISGTWIGESH